MYNKLIMVIKNDKVQADDKQMARMLLSQYNTAGGTMIRKEVSYFLEDMVEKYGTMPTSLTLEQELANIIAEEQEFKSYWSNRPKCREEKNMIVNRMNQYHLAITNLRKRIGNN